jgi:hypothetical protein
MAMTGSGLVKRSALPALGALLLCSCGPKDTGADPKVVDLEKAVKRLENRVVSLQGKLKSSGEDRDRSLESLEKRIAALEEAAKASLQTKSDSAEAEISIYETAGGVKKGKSILASYRAETQNRKSPRGKAPRTETTPVLHFTRQGRKQSELKVPLQETRTIEYKPRGVPIWAIVKRDGTSIQIFKNVIRVTDKEGKEIGRHDDRGRVMPQYNGLVLHAFKLDDRLTELGRLRKIEFGD